MDSSAPVPESINSSDPLFAMEAKKTKLKKLSLSETAELTFNELTKNVVLKVRALFWIYLYLIIIIINCGS